MSERLTPERLAAIRGRYWDELSSADITDLWEHIDALTERLDAIDARAAKDAARAAAYLAGNIARGVVSGKR